MGRSGPATTWRDAALSAGVLALTVATALTGRDGDDRPLAPWGWLLIVISAAVLVGRQRHPMPVLLVTGVGALLYYPLGFPDSAVGLSLIIALYTVSRLRGRLLSIGAAVALVLAFALLTGDVTGIAPILVLAVVLGEVARDRERQLVEARERAALAEATRESEASRRALQERLRIARDLHDVLGHRISLINVQAGAALHTRTPEGAFAALEAIRAAGKDAMREVRAVLGVLRQGDGGAGDEPVRPSPALGDLPELLHRTEAAGLPVRARIDSPPVALPAPVGLAAYRIVQEALTNTMRHAAASRAEVEVLHSGREVVVTVEDDGSEPADPASIRDGSGLRGMAERAAAVGGTVSAGPRPGGGFRVTARLPFAPDSGGPG